MVFTRNAAKKAAEEQQAVPGLRLDTNQEEATRLLRMEEALARLDETVAGIVESNARNEMSSARDRANLTELSIKVEDNISSLDAFRRDISIKVDTLNYKVEESRNRFDEFRRKARVLNEMVNSVIIRLYGQGGEGGLINYVDTLKNTFYTIVGHLTECIKEINANVSRLEEGMR